MYFSLGTLGDCGKTPHVTREVVGAHISGGTKEQPRRGAVTEEPRREMPQRVRALQVAQIFSGPRTK